MTRNIPHNVVQIPMQETQMSKIERRKVAKLREMLTYCRPEGGKAQGEFNRRYLVPLMGTPDANGNFATVINHPDKRPVRHCLMAHHDTVHKTDGRQSVSRDGDVLSLEPGQSTGCLGADCTTGVWLILEMISQGIPGAYVVFAGEEIGCVGSQAFAANPPGWFQSIEIAVSLDRRGADSIVTHQCGLRTCSDTFANALAGLLAPHDLAMGPDDTGVYTDSNEFSGIVSECTNISVGYLNQHTQGETQSVSHAIKLRRACLEIDWDSLPASRDPSADVYESHWQWSWREEEEGTPYGVRSNVTGSDLEAIVANYPGHVADLLEQLGYDAISLSEELCLDWEGF